MLRLLLLPAVACCCCCCCVSAAINVPPTPSLVGDEGHLCNFTFTARVDHSNVLVENDTGKLTIGAICIEPAVGLCKVLVYTLIANTYIQWIWITPHAS
jgi:hypothetical protein